MTMLETLSKLVNPTRALSESAAAADETEEGTTPTSQERALMMHLSNVSHGVNHFQNQMLTMLYPSIMLDLGMGYAEVGILSAIRSVVTAISQGSYGLITPLVSGCKILGFANFGIALGTFISGIALTYPMLVVARCVSALGSSAQHPVGYSILTSYFPKARGSAIAINTSASNVGTLLATPIATALLVFLPWMSHALLGSAAEVLPFLVPFLEMPAWRQIFFLVAFASIIMGWVYLRFRDYGAPDRSGSGGARLKQGFSAYRRVLKNRNMMIIALVFMIGAAGQEAGINQTYFAPHLAQDFGYSALVVGILITAINIGAIGGPIIFGWLSDRMDRVKVLQASLIMSVIGSLWVAWQGPGEIALFIGLMMYSAVTHSRGTLTQTIVADSASDEDRDAAFSLYFLLGFLAQPFWLLVTGWMMDTAGFSIAVTRVAISYALGSALLFLLKDPRKAQEPERV
jgi:predicted MFS family arabinose efflux permease